MDFRQLKSFSKDKIPEQATKLSISDIDFLVEALTEKDETARYHAFLLLQANSRFSPLVYAHWAVFQKKLESSNASQRSLGLILLSENVRWDSEGKFGKTLDAYLDHCVDERFVTSRQAIQGLTSVVGATSVYNEKIKQRLTALSFDRYKESQQSLLKRDVAGIIALIS
jgi:hypothetical protein